MDVITAYHSGSYRLISRMITALSHAFSLRSTNDKRIEGKPYVGTSHSGYPDPPNIQINLSSANIGKKARSRQYEMFGFSILAVMIQLGLIAVSAATVFHSQTRTAIGTDPETYGFPCYVTGSVLLSLGMGLCSRSIEQSTTEYAWTLRDKNLPKPTKLDKSHLLPRLIFIQRGQMVQEMKFDPHIIFAGRKHHILTSNRSEDVDKDMYLQKGPGSKRGLRTSGSNNRDNPEMDSSSPPVSP